MTTPTSSASSSPNDAARKLFESIARTTWGWLGEARQRRLSFSEETVTDIASLEIAGDTSAQVKVAKSTRQQERRYGIDWMWFIGNPTQGYSRYAVQAKKITLDSSRRFGYRLRHRVSKTPGSEFQIDRLKQFANRARAIPLYCFYNNVDSNLAARHWHCKTHPDPPDDIRQMGCTIVPLDAVQLVHDPYRSKNFSAIHRDLRAIPWRCLFHPSCESVGIHSRSDYGQGILEIQDPRRDQTSPIRLEGLPAFMLDDDPVIDTADVVQELDLAGLFDDFASDAVLTPNARIATPKWFVVIETGTRQLDQL